MLLENHLRRALANDELELYYQPQIALDSGLIIGAEVLLRWHHPELGDIPPGKFIPIAEDAGLIEQIGAWTLHRACRQAMTWRGEGRPSLQIAVNLSGHQLNREDLINTVSSILNQTGMSPAQLELEVTESVLMQHMGRAAKLLGELKQMGISLAIDDFGTGYSSLNYLKRLPIHKLKIDRSFVQDIPGDADDMAIVNAIITLGHNLQLTVIAEGVETEQQRAWLKGCRCDEIQGRINGMPMAADEFVRVWERNLDNSERAQLA